MQIILDISNNTLKSDMDYFRRMLKELAEVIPEDCKHEIIIKTQLFLHEGDNIPMRPDFFYLMARVAYREYGIKVTASVFDKPSVDTLLGLRAGYELPFVKIANRVDLRGLAYWIPRGIQIYQSVEPKAYWAWGAYYGQRTLTTPMLCVSQYPATVGSYDLADDSTEVYAISDHTVGLDLYKKYKDNLLIYEKHLVLPDSTGLDSGPWAITPYELAPILNGEI